MKRPMMKTPPLTRDQVRRVDQIAMDQWGMLGIVVMENAGRGAAEIIASISRGGQVLILCGKGNNGGDGYVMARHLQIAGIDCQIVAVGNANQLPSDARTNAEIAAAAGIPIEVVDQETADLASLRGRFDRADLIVDALLGTGAQGDPRGIYATLVNAANASDATTIALDIPTGLDCDSGKPGSPTFRADHTITFVAAKVGFSAAQAADYLGTVHEVGIGVPRQVIAQAIAADDSAQK
ncbi:Bifunctional NAD(P)H-hydrate repair enzyme Nnr [Rubripirellula lacrimiformis]|uniref:NAD(P)H-hydrate epimerase n=1 Tax=Rubripirellula lacrimiformis TaxID=1930273 RepID=A0A517NGU8_9BACT|nr:NAD(P)H-hydrate epimerase [Rubripirellula lacrimiformis]QDT06360.1 Bifunctional NAD(P)H-hydrate repair enzyme Nnr [Rubripirellula lacrimiformis]